MSVQSLPDSDVLDGQDEVRLRIISAGGELLAKSGREALTTRAVAALAGVQAPTIYRLFGDKLGLLEAVAEHVLQQFVQAKAAHVKRDPLDDLRMGWDLNIAFGLAHPAIYSIINRDPEAGHVSPAAAAGLELLTAKMQRLAKCGLLRVSVERAVNLMRASGIGTVLTLLSMPADHRDLGLSEAAREAVIAAVSLAAPAVEQPGVAGAAIALRASLEDAPSLTPGERLLLSELLRRLSGD